MILRIFLIFFGTSCGIDIRCDFECSLEAFWYNVHAFWWFIFYFVFRWHFFNCWSKERPKISARGSPFSFLFHIRSAGGVFESSLALFSGSLLIPLGSLCLAFGSILVPLGSLLLIWGPLGFFVIDRFWLQIDGSCGGWFWDDANFVTGRPPPWQLIQPRLFTIDCVTLLRFLIDFGYLDPHL